MDITYNTLVVLVGTSLLGMNSGLIGSFSVLRGRALLGDVLAHAALPGLCLGFLFLLRRSVGVMLFGALVACLIAVAAITLLRRFTRVKDDAVMGVIRSVFMGAGIVLITRIQYTVTEGSKAGLDSYILGKTAGMLSSDVVVMAGVSVASLAMILLLFKELRLTAFDPGFARVQGWPAGMLDLLQMSLVAVAIVAGLPAVGAILVAAMLILPGATMRFWTDRLGPLLLGAVIVGGCTGVGGTLLSAYYSRMPAGPSIILVGTAIFAVSMLIAPRRGLAARLIADGRFRAELRARKLLTSLFEQGESARDLATWIPAQVIAERLRWNSGELLAVFAEAERIGLVERRSAADSRDVDMRLTIEGRRRAANRVAEDRIWAAYLEAYPEESGPNAPFDIDALADVVPRDERSRLEAELRRAGRLPEIDESGRLR